MNIALVLPELGVGGGVAVALHYANALHRLGRQVDIINCSASDYTGWWGAIDARVISCASEEHFQGIFAGEYDCAIATFWPTVYFVRQRLVPARSCIYLVQGDEENFYPEDDEKAREAVASTLSGPETKVVVSHYLQDMLSRRYPDQRFHCIQNGIDLERFTNPEPFMVKGKHLRVLVEGPIGLPHKRVLEALACLKNIDNIEVWLVSATEGEIIGLTPDLTLRGVPYDKMASVYASCDVLLKFSRSEGFGLPVLEMMATGGIAVVNDFGGQRDFLSSGINGIVLDEISESAVFDALTTIVGQRDFMHEEALKTAASSGWAEQPSQLVELIETLRVNSSTDEARISLQYRTAARVPYTAGGHKRVGGATTWSIQQNHVSPEYVTPMSRIAGWCAMLDGSALSEAVLLIDDISYELSTGYPRPDVQQHLGSQSDDYGYWADIVIGEEMQFQYSCNGEAASIPLRSLDAAQYQDANVQLHIEAASPSEYIAICSNESIQAIYIKLTEKQKITVNGHVVFTRHISEQAPFLLCVPESAIEHVIQR